MKTVKAVIMAGLLFSSLYGEQKVSTQKKGKPTAVAFVNLAQIMNQDPRLIAQTAQEWNELYGKHIETRKPVEADIKALADKFEKGRAEFETLQKSSVATREALEKKYEDVARMQYELQNKAQEADRFDQAEVAKIVNRIAPKVDKAIEQVRLAQGWNLIIDRAVAVDKDFDVTQDVLDILNKQYADEKKATPAKK